jgi:(1->4)-alpha-D-glucan 1-alpha-D-glucosylmutase
MTPRATMRLQFHKGFTFADAERLVPYMARLGISHLYASPITTARSGSMHGYDVIDPTRVNPELGGEEGLRRLVVALREEGFGLIVDIVPNHMAVGAENAWWFDVLKHGEASRYAPYFDIAWNAEDPELRGRVLLPVLGKPLNEAIDGGELSLADGAGGVEVHYYQQRFPVADADRNGNQALAELLAQQHYRLAWWRIANDEINWRRFFDINELAGLRMEHPAAFEDVHALILRLYAEGLIDGVRVDHIDGLSDPAGYCRALRARLDGLTSRRPATAPRDRPYIVVEKILLRGETLPTSWQTDGTSGYDFMNDVSAVQHDTRGEAPLTALWQSISGRSGDFETEEQSARREIIARSFSAQLESCAASFHRLARAEGTELSRASLRRGLIELLAHFPIYRTYGTSAERPTRDHPFLEMAVAGAKCTCLSMDRIVIDQLAAWLGTRNENADVAKLQDRAVTQFQQLSAPIAAKAVEDTAFYRYGRLLSRNDVGFDAGRLSASAADFHEAVLRRQSEFPHAMLATATHDHKRGEDVRARLTVLSEYAGEWAEAVPRWIEQLRPLRREIAGALLPHTSDIAMLLQMIVGAWPLDLRVNNDRARKSFAERLAQWQEKALREAKLETDWAVPNEPYETAARELLVSLIERNALPTLLNDVVAFANKISAAGAVNGLAQTLLKLTVAGVPDIYQGTEFWDFSLVDPDNRRPVDFAERTAGLQNSTRIADLMSNWRDGRIKQDVIARTLTFRRAHPLLFLYGDYQPLEVRGEHAERIVAFARQHGSDVAVTIVPRIASRLLRTTSEIAFDPGNWANTVIVGVPAQVRANVLTGKSVAPEGEVIPVSSIFDELPLALLSSIPAEAS